MNDTSNYDFDVIIIGAGPAGSTAALQLANSGLKVGVIEADAFPRDKICGDALSVDVVNQLAMISDKLAEDFKKLSTKTPSYGVKISAPNGKYIDIPFVHKGERKCGYICKRFDFDQLIFSQLCLHSNIKVFEYCKAENIEYIEGGVQVISKAGTFIGRMIVGADGAHSIVTKKLSKIKVDLDHYSAGLRVYYKNVCSFHQENYIELHFFKDILPGYLWVFPLPNNQANVGIGMLSSAVSKNKVNLKAVLKNLLSTDPRFKERFAKATPLESMKGFGLPLGSKKRDISGERFLLVGDAAGLIDPFSGEGIANALRSGRIAAEHTLSCFKTQDFSACANKAYDEEIYRRIWKELKVSRSLQHFCKYPWLFNFVVGKANQSEYMRKVLVEALAQVDVKRILTRPGFYLRLLFK